jgi:hypothetical protein
VALSRCNAFRRRRSRIEAHCGSLLRLGAATWWKRLVGCDKYYGDALVWDNSFAYEYDDKSEYDGGNGSGSGGGTWRVAPDHVGEYFSIRCASKRDDAYAWEATLAARVPPRGADGAPVAYYGCLDDTCCGALRRTLRLNAAALFGGLALVWCVRDR